jgi:hypothetical protein
VGVSVLQGTFETLSLPEVLGLLSSARKSGALWLDAGPISGVAHLEDGHCQAAEVGDQRGPVETGSALSVRLVDLCFAVVCQESGSFRFVADDRAPWSCPEQVELSDVLVEVDRLLKQWREILRVIPSLECRPQLLDELEVDELVIDRERWVLLVAIDGRRTVRELVQRTNRPVIELCQTLLELIEVGAIGVIDPAAARAPDVETAPSLSTAAAPEPAGPASQVDDAVREPVSAPDTEAVYGEPPAVVTIDPGREPDVWPEAEPAPEPPAAEREPVPVASGADAPDKGAFLRLFSGLRDSS